MDEKEVFEGVGEGSGRRGRGRGRGRSSGERGEGEDFLAGLLEFLFFFFFICCGVRGVRSSKKNEK